VENRAKMSHWIIGIPCYGTKSSKIQAKLSHRTAVWDSLSGKPSQNVPLDYRNPVLWDKII